MNFPARIPPITYEPVTGNHYTATAEDFDDGCFVRTDALTGKQLATGTNKLGLTVTLPLDVPLCKGCCQAIPSTGLCHDCEVIHLDIAERAELDPRELGDGRYGVAA